MYTISNVSNDQEDIYSILILNIFYNSCAKVDLSKTILNTPEITKWKL